MMGIEYYNGVPGAAIDIKTPQDLFDAVDLLHTQAMEAFGEDDNPYLPALEQAMAYLTERFGLFPS